MHKSDAEKAADGPISVISVAPYAGPGITRAMRTLTLTYCRDRTKYGSVASCAPSSFIKELAPELLDEVDLQKLLSTPVAEASVKNRFAQMRAALASLDS